MTMSRTFTVVWPNIVGIRKKIWHNIDKILKSVQIVALCVAGLWT